MSTDTPVSRAQSRLDELYGARPAADQSPMAAFEGLSRKSRIPVNVLLALDEGRGDLKATESMAARLSAAVAEGKPIEAAIMDLTGDEARGAAILETAYSIADQIDPPAPAAPDVGSDGKVGAGEALGGLGRNLVGMGARAGGGAIEALGVSADEALRYGNDPATDGPSLARDIGRFAGDAVRGAGESIQDGASEDYRAKVAGTRFGGNIADPSTWTAGEDPSVLGVLNVAAQGVGSMAPIVATAALTRNPAAVSALVGGLMSGGEGIESGRKFVQDAAATLDENGQPEIAKLPEYRALTDGGMDHARAVEELTRRAENSSGFRQGLVGALGGAATARILRGADGWLGQGGRLTRALKKGGTGAIEEGTQEVAEGAASGLGIEAATGANVDPLADSFGAFVGGALAGGGIGGAAGALGPGERGKPRPDPVPETPPPLLALPSPEAAPQQPGGALVSAPRLIEQDPTYRNPNFSFPALPAPSGLGIAPEAATTGTGLVAAPRQITHNPDAQNPNWSWPTGSPATPTAGRPLGLPAPMIPADGSGADQAAAPVLSPPSLGAGAVAPELGIAPPAPLALPAPPAGPVEAIARQLQASMPASAPEPAPRFPDQKPGGSIVLGHEDGANENAVFLGETPEGAVVRIQGQEVLLTPEQFDQARDRAEINEAKLKEGTANVEPADAASGGYQQQAAPGLPDGPGNGGEGIEAGGPAVEAGMPGSGGLDQRSEPEQPGNGAALPGDLGGVDVADRPGELGGELTAEPEARGAEQPDLVIEPIRQPTAPVPSDPIKSGPGFLKALNTTKGAAKKGKLRAAATEDYFTPGNVVRSYGGGVDRVVAFDPATRAVTVQQVIKRDGGWVDDPTSPQRNHSTLPDDRALANGPVARAEVAKEAPAPQRRPFITYVANRLGGINPGGSVAAELRHRGITARTAPGLFRRGGHKDLDNIPASEHPDLVGAIPLEGESSYLSPQAIIEAIIEEVAGRPLAFGRHAQDQQAARDVKASRRAVEADEAVPVEPGSVPDPERDIRDPMERLAEIEASVDEILDQMPGSALTAEARAGIIDRINRDGGDIAEAVYDAIVRSERDAIPEAASDGRAAGEVSGIPFGDEGEAGPAGPDAGTDGGPDAEGAGVGSSGEPEGSDVRSAADEGGLEQPATEPGADGLPQTIMPGMEGTEDQRQSRMTAQQRAEIEARQQQSKARRLDGNSGDAGPLFDEQDTLFQRDMSEPVATLTGDELGAWEDIRQLGRKAEAWYRNNLVGRKPVTNAETGWSIQFDGTGARKTGGRKGDVLYRLVPAIPAILENGRVISSEADTRGRGEIRAVHKLSARVSMGGREYSVIAAIREKTDGTYHYDLSMDREASGFAAATVQEQRSRTSALEGGPAVLNLDFADESVNTITPAEARRVALAARDRLRDLGMTAPVEVGTGPSGALGALRNGIIHLFRTDDGWRHTLDHEAIHLLRQRNLIRPDEWKALVRAARARPELMAAVDRAYAHLPPIGRMEEAVAELFADWRQDREAAGLVRRAFERIQAVFRALASALRGEGFTDGALVMQRIASGDVGGRGPDGGGGEGDFSAHQQQRPLGLGRVIGAVALTGNPYSATLRPSDQGDNPSATRERRDLSGSELTSIGSIRRAAALHGKVFVRWSAGPEFDMKPGAKSRDTVSGETHAGLSAVEITEDFSDIDILKMIRDYAFLKGESATGAFLYAGDVVGTDSDGAPSIRAKAYVGRVSDNLIEFAMDDRNLERISIKDRIASGKRVLADPNYGKGSFLPAYTPESVRALEERLEGLGGPVDDSIIGADDPRILEQRDMAALKAQLSNPKFRAAGLIGNLHWKRTPQQAAGWMSNLLTDAMGKDARFNALGLVPGRALFTELARNLPAAQDYLALKEKMDAMRNDWQVKSSGMVDDWTKTARKNPKANQALMEIMHDSTLAGLDPSKDDGWHRPIDEEARKMLEGKPSPAQSEWARITLAQAEERQEAWEELRSRFEKLPKPFRDLYATIRDGYSDMADGMDNALIENIRAMSKVIVKKADREYRKEMDRIRDEGLTGDAKADAVEKATQKRDAAHARAARGSGSRLQQMRQTFESNRLAGPYFPLARFGNYFVTIRDADGKVTSFSRFETEREQQAWADEARRDNLGTVQSGVLGGDVNLREQVDPRFLADVEELLSEAGASKEMMDQVWQRWLETLPDQSVRTNKIHRKGRAGFNKDAIRSFASSMFHGAHQMARLQFGAQMEETLAEAEEQASKRPDANRAGFVVREMRQRHSFTMSPTNNPWVTKATSLAFVWYLGVSPAAALVNLSQTTVVGIPLMAARYRKGGASGAMRELSRASLDFMRGRGAVARKVGGIPVSTGLWTAENSPDLTAEERQAMEQGYQRGVIDKTQAHDLASVADSGVEYNPTREKVMRVIGWGFHHAERFNREVTYLAAYRMARGEGLDHATAIESAAGMTWGVHYDYANSSRPRAMTGDAAKIFTIFKNFQVNMLFRLFRDAHQSLHGADAETRREARMQLSGVTLSLMAHAGIRGVWGYALLTTLLSWFMPGAEDGDDIDEWLQDALLMEGDGVGTAAWNFIAAAALNGTPGHLTGVDLTNRIGMPELLIRSSGRDLEGKDQWYYLLEQLAGPLGGIAGNLVVNGPTVVGQATNLVADRDSFDGEEMTRAVEKVVPVFVRNVIRTGRYSADGVTTWNGDPVVDDLNPYQLLMQLQGFTPAEVAEQYKINNRLKNKERRITDQRQDIMRQIGDAVREGDAIPESALRKMREFNQAYPGWPITSDSIRQSVRSRQQASERNEGGVSINTKLDGPLREDLAPAIY